MSDNNAEGNKGYDCPSCERSFGTEYGVKQHHAKSHNESLAYTTLVCEVCGDEFEVKDSHAEDRKTCGNGCGGTRQSEKRTGKDNPNWKGGEVKIECKVCGEMFPVTPAVEDERVTCSPECFSKNQAKKWVGENNPNYKEPIEKSCVICGEKYEISPHYADIRKTCGDDECYRENMRRVNSGKTHPSWKGGYEGYYGPNWEEQRQKALKKYDHKCAICGMGSGEHRQKYGCGLNVHHIIPFDRFGLENYKEANRVENLCILCQKHHTMWEGIPVAPNKT